MRSRYSAYVLLLENYLLATWHPDTRPHALSLSADNTRWLGLKIVHSVTAGDSARVEFVARFRQGGGAAQRLHECSRFVRLETRWYYLDGDFPVGNSKVPLLSTKDLAAKRLLK